MLLARKLLSAADVAAREAGRVTRGDGDLLASALADLTEVVLAVCKGYGIDPGEVRNRAVVKRASLGGFEGRLVWDGAEQGKDGGGHVRVVA